MPEKDKFFTVEIDKSEHYPIFGITTTAAEKSYDPKVRISGRRLGWVNQVIFEYQEVQKYLARRYKEANTRKEGRDLTALSETEKAARLLNWFNNQVVDGRELVTMKEFDKEYKRYFSRRALWYGWEYFFRDHGYVGLTKAGKDKNNE